MRSIFVVLLVAVLAASAGCSGVICKSEMATAVDANALQAAVDKGLAQSGLFSDSAATAILKRNAATFASYADGKTVNLLEYLFDKAKTILASGEYAQRLDNAKLLSAETAARADLPDASPGFRQQAVVKESNILQFVKDAKDGKRSQ